MFKVPWTCYCIILPSISTSGKCIFYFYITHSPLPSVSNVNFDDSFLCQGCMQNLDKMWSQIVGQSILLPTLKPYRSTFVLKPAGTDSNNTDEMNMSDIPVSQVEWQWYTGFYPVKLCCPLGRKQLELTELASQNAGCESTLAALCRNDLPLSRFLISLSKQQDNASKSISMCHCQRLKLTLWCVELKHDCPLIILFPLSKWGWGMIWDLLSWTLKNTDNLLHVKFCMSE